MKIEIKEEYIDKLKERVNDLSEFKSVEKYINYILKQVIERLEDEGKIEKENEELYSKEEGEEIKDKLRSLGYLD